MRNLYYDTVLYSSESLELLIKTVGADRCLFGTERPGVGTVKDPRTGKWLDETRYLIEAFDWLSAADKKLIFEDNAKKLFKLERRRRVRRSTHEPRHFQIWPSAAPGALRLRPGHRCRRSPSITPTAAARNWPLFLAKEGGYYQKYGLDVKLVFGVHPAGIAMLVSGEGQMVNSSLEQLMQAASQDGSLVLMGSSLNRGMFALMANKTSPASRT